MLQFYLNHCVGTAPALDNRYRSYHSLVFGSEAHIDKRRQVFSRKADSSAKQNHPQHSAVNTAVEASVENLQIDDQDEEETSEQLLYALRGVDFCLDELHNATSAGLLRNRLIYAGQTKLARRVWIQCEGRPAEEFDATVKQVIGQLENENKTTLLSLPDN